MSEPPVQHFRVADLDDVEVVVALVESAYRGERAAATWSSEAELIGGQRTDATMVRATIGGPDTMVLLLISSDADADADTDDAVIGCCELRSPDEHGTSLLGMFAVDPDLQAAGVGRRILAEGERVAAAMGARSVELHVIGLRHELIAWYERRGYRRTGERIPFPYGDERFGVPRRDDLHFEVLVKHFEPLEHG